MKDIAAVALATAITMAVYYAICMAALAVLTELGGGWSATSAAVQSVRRRTNRAASAVTSAEITRGCRRQRDYEATNLNHLAPMPAQGNGESRQCSGILPEPAYPN